MHSIQLAVSHQDIVDGHYVQLLSFAGGGYEVDTTLLSVHGAKQLIHAMTVNGLYKLNDTQCSSAHILVFERYGGGDDGPVETRTFSGSPEAIKSLKDTI